MQLCCASCLGDYIDGFENNLQHFTGAFLALVQSTRIYSLSPNKTISPRYSLTEGNDCPGGQKLARPLPCLAVEMMACLVAEGLALPLGIHAGQLPRGTCRCLGDKLLHAFFLKLHTRSSPDKCFSWQ